MSRRASGAQRSSQQHGFGNLLARSPGFLRVLRVNLNAINGLGRVRCFGTGRLSSGGDLNIDYPDARSRDAKPAVLSNLQYEPC